VAEAGLHAVQLHLDPIRAGAWGESATVAALRGVRILSGMMAMAGEDYSTPATIRETGGVAPDATWAANREAARANADVAQRLGISLVTFHAGFIPHGDGAGESAARARLLGRVAEVARVFAARGVRVALETGQESARGLLGALDEVNERLDAGARVGVNFDPANMILYAMGDPGEALRLLAPHVRQVHLKDALPPRSPGTWGEEVPLGAGAVDWASFFAALAGLGVDACIEREAGESRVEDVRHAAAFARARARFEP
jgi:sugar phosphate isomerase/epimerase